MKSKAKILSLLLTLLLALALCMCVVFAGCSSSGGGDDSGDNPSGQEGDTPSDDNDDNNNGGGGSNDDSGNEGGNTGNSGSSGTVIEGLVAPVGDESMTTTTLKADALEALGTIETGTVYTTAEDVKAEDSGVTELDSKKISAAGAYYIEGSTFSDGTSVAGSKIDVQADGVTLYLINAELSNNKNVIGSDYGLTLVLIGDSTVTETKDDTTTLDITADLTMLGNGSLTIAASDDTIAVKNGISQAM